jgi:hypothetical protein
MGTIKRFGAKGKWLEMKKTGLGLAEQLLSFLRAGTHTPRPLLAGKDDDGPSFQGIAEPTRPQLPVSKRLDRIEPRRAP